MDVQTDKAGFYIFKGYNSFGKLKVGCIPSNKALKADSAVVDLNYSGGDKKNPWDKGNASVTVDFKLKKKRH